MSTIDTPENDKIPNLVMQIRKSMDTGGSIPILFKDGGTFVIPVRTMTMFLERYASFKPIDREEMQDIAIQSKDAFVSALTDYDRPKAPKSIYTY